MTLLELLQLIRRHLKLVIALPVVLALLAAVFCWGFMQNQYTASTSIYALTKLDANTDASTSYTDLTGSQLLANDLAKLADDEQLQKEVASQLSMVDLEGYDVSVESSTTSRVMSISVTGPSASTAAVIANKMAEEIGDTAKAVMDVKAVNIVSKAQAPEEPSGPKRPLYVAVAFLAGLFIAIAIIVLMDMLNTRIRNEREAAELLEVPVIGRFPEARGGSR
ncbi:MAG: YveK family protein [Coriobacteriales bacterium]